MPPPDQKNGWPAPDFDGRIQTVIKKMAELGHPVKVTSRNRSAEEQLKLYSQGRTRPGPIVTELSGEPGKESRHQLGMAADLDFDGNAPDWDLLGQTARSNGLEWGGDWTSLVDKHHIQMPKSKEIAKGSTIHSNAPPTNVRVSQGDVSVPPAKPGWLAGLSDTASKVKDSALSGLNGLEALLASGDRFQGDPRNSFPRTQRTADINLPEPTIDAEPDSALSSLAALGDKVGTGVETLLASDKFQGDPRNSFPRKQRFADINLPAEKPAQSASPTQLKQFLAPEPAAPVAAAPSQAEEPRLSYKDLPTIEYQPNESDLPLPAASDKISQHDDSGIQSLLMNGGESNVDNNPVIANHDYNKKLENELQGRAANDVFASEYAKSMGSGGAPVSENIRTSGALGQADLMSTLMKLANVKSDLDASPSTGLDMQNRLKKEDEARRGAWSQGFDSTQEQAYAGRKAEADKMMMPLRVEQEKTRGAALLDQQNFDQMRQIMGLGKGNQAPTSASPDLAGQVPAQSAGTPPPLQKEQSWLSTITGNGAQPYSSMMDYLKIRSERAKYDMGVPTPLSAPIQESEFAKLEQIQGMFPGVRGIQGLIPIFKQHQSSLGHEMPSGSFQRLEGMEHMVLEAMQGLDDPASKVKFSADGKMSVGADPAAIQRAKVSLTDTLNKIRTSKMYLNQIFPGIDKNGAQVSAPPQAAPAIPVSGGKVYLDDNGNPR